MAQGVLAHLINLSLEDLLNRAENWSQKRRVFLFSTPNMK